MYQSLAAKLALAAATLVVAPSAQAALILSINPIAGGFTATFGNNDVQNGAFNDSVIFVIPQGTLNGTFSTRLDTKGGVDVSGAGDGIFVNTTPFTLFFTATSTFGELNDTSFPAGAYTFRVKGQNSGGISSYAGTLNFVAVPEPAAWAMMISGFGLVGAFARRRAVSAKVRYA